MSTDPVSTLCRLRHNICEEARRTLASCLAAEDSARIALRVAEQAIWHEQEEASRIDTSDGAVEAFAAWLPRGRQNVADAREAHERALAATAQARAVLAVARANLEAVERLAAEQQRQRAAQAAKREQDTLDEAANRPPTD
jgi:flagellar biosynthesis chaperone FliJ